MPPQSQEVVMKRVPLACLVVVAVLAFASVAVTEAQIPRPLPHKATITPEKTQLLPGEEIDIVVTDFLTHGDYQAHGDTKIGIWVDGGSVWNGDSWVPDSGAIFKIGSGRVLIKYKAPLQLDDKIRVYVVVERMYQVYDAEEAPLVGWEGAVVGDMLTIGEQEIEVIAYDYAKMTYSTYYRNEQSGSVSEQQIEVTVGLRFEMLMPDQPSGTAVLGTFGGGVPYRVTSATVLDFSGSIRGKYCNYRLVSAKPAHHDTALMIYSDQKTGGIESVKLPLISAMLGWGGPGGCVPPDEVSIGPVTEWDDESGQKEIEDLADEIEIDLQVDDGFPDLSKMMQLQQAIKKAVVHPDYVASTQNSIDHASNTANFTDSGEGWLLRKKFSWEVERDMSTVPLTK